MAEAQQGQGQAPPEGTPDGTQVTPQDAPEGLVPQKTVDKLIGSTRTETRDSTLNGLLEEVGYESLDDLKAAALDQKSAQELVKTEADRAKDEAEKVKAQLKAEREGRIADAKTNAMREALRDADINPERLKSAMRLADLSALEVDKEGNVSGLDEVVESVREEAPEFFGATERQRINAPQINGTGLDKPGSQQTPEEMQAAWLGQFLGR